MRAAEAKKRVTQWHDWGFGRAPLWGEARCRTCPARRIGATISGVNAGLRQCSAAALIFGLLGGCQASVGANANVNGNGAHAEGEAALHEAESSNPPEGQGEMVRSATPTSGTTVSSPATPSEASRVLLGARHDLKLRPGQGSASCECLSVALAGAHNAAMVWSAAAPDIDENTQLSIALSSEGQACKDEPKKSLGASYWGYRLSGNDVVVLVEAAHGGRPQTTGAIIPKPVGPGQVYVAPAHKRLPYGRALQGKGLCKIGNPGQPRTAPFTELEVGTDAPPTPTHAITRAGNSVDTGNDPPTTIEMPSN